MKYWIIAATFLGANVQMAAPAQAYAISFEQVMCPLEKLGEEEGLALSKAMANFESPPSDAEIDKLAVAVDACATQFKWSEADSKFTLQFNISIITQMGIEDKLSAMGVTAADYETGMEGQGPEVLQAVLDDTDNSTIIQQAVEKLMADKGDKVTEEMAGYLGAYLTTTAQSRLLAMEIAENGEVEF